MSLINSRSAISLPGSADGVTPYGSPAGPTRSLSGPAPVPASRSRARASGKGTGTRGICGRRSGGSSAREQVAGKDGRLWLARVRTDLEALAYAVGAADLCAASVSAPHIRQRLFWVADAGGAERRPPSEGGYVVNGSHAGREEAAGGFGFHVAHAVGLASAPRPSFVRPLRELNPLPCSTMSVYTSGRPSLAATTACAASWRAA